MQRSTWFTPILIIILLIASLQNISAQNAGTIKGRVLQTDGTPVSYATVALLNTTMGAASDAQGNYTISKVPAGNYQVRASAIGFKAVTVSVTAGAAGTVTQDFTLAPDVLNMQTVVVTGTISPIPKLESSVAISTLTPLQLEQANPRSTTEVLRYVPGFTRVESSGGEVNENISVRGILGVEYVMFMEDGLPVFPTMHTFFMNADNLFRADENIQTVEVVRGGNSALFGSNTPGAIINFINKTGGPNFSGSVRATGGTEGLARYDFNINGPFTEDLRFNLGGFYRFDRGVRYPGFPGVRGGQIKGNITKLMDNGYIKTSFKIIDDRNQFILPLPFQNPDDPEFVPGFSKYGAMNTEEANNVVVPTPSGDLQFPLEDGLRTQAYWLTGDVSFDFPGAWTIRNMAQYMQNTQAWNGIFTGQPTNATEYFNSLKLPAGTSFGLFYTNHLDPVSGKKLPFDLSSNAGLAFVSPSTLVTVQKPMSAFQDQVQIQKTFEKKHTISMGLYFANYTQTNRWIFGDILMDVRDNPRLLDLVTYSGADTNQITQNGFRNFISLYRNGTGTTTIFSVMLGGSFQLMDRLRIDLGGRYESDDFVQSAENQSVADLDANPATAFNNEQWGNKSFRHFSRTIDDWAVSGGLNFTLTDEIALYAQGSRAFKMPALDEFLDAQAQNQIDLFENRRLNMYEGGVKYSSSQLALTLNGFWAQLTNIVGQGFEIDPATGLGKWVLRTDPDSRSYGAEFELSVTPFSGLNFLGVGTYTKAETVEAAGAALTAGGIPDFIGNIALSYNMSGFFAYADFHYVGARDLVNAVYDRNSGRYTTYSAFQTLPSYNYMNLGAGYTIPNQGLTLSVDVLNVYQSLGLEEGNPRLPGVKAYYFVARPILPRRLTASLRYMF